MRRMKVCATTAAVLLSLVVTVSGVIAIDPGQGNSHVVLMNAENSAASVVPVLMHQSGNLAENLPGFDLNGYGSKVLLPSSWTVGSGFIGSMTAYSDKELASTALLTWTGGDAPDGKSNASYIGSSEPSGELYFPDANITPSFYSALSVQNTSGDSVEVTLTYYRADGSQTAQIVDDIPGEGQHTYDLSNPSDPTVPDLLTLVGSSQWKGAVYVQATDPLDDPVLVGVAVRHWKKWSGAYRAFSAGGTDLYFPVITRRINNKGWFQYTSVQLFNTQPTTTTISMEFRDEGGTLVNNSDPKCNNYQFDVGGRQFFSFTTHQQYPGLQMDADCLNFGTQFDGSLYVSATQDMAGVANNIRMQRDMVGTYKAALGGSDEILLPAVYRKQASPGGNWKIFSNILLMNLDDTLTTVVTVDFLDRGGNVLLTFNSDPAEKLYPMSPLVLNTKYGGQNHIPSDYDQLGYAYQGAVRVTSSGGIPIVAVADTIWTGASAGGASYNGENR